METFEGRRVWPLNGHEVTRLCLDYRFSIEIWWFEEGSPDNSVTIVIGNRFSFHHDGREQSFNPEQAETLGPVLAILHKPVDSLTAYLDGRLVLQFADGAELAVEKDAQYESWETFGKGKLADIGMLCSPHEGPPW